MKQEQNKTKKQIRQISRRDVRRNTQTIQFNANDISILPRNEDNLSSFQSSLNFFRMLEEKNRTETAKVPKNNNLCDFKDINKAKPVTISVNSISNDNYCGIMSFKKSNHTVKESVLCFNMIKKMYLPHLNSCHKINEENHLNPCHKFNEENTDEIPLQENYILDVNNTEEKIEDSDNIFIPERLFDFKKVKSMFNKRLYET